MKILFVCTGNTCRSCMAEAIARDMAAKFSCDVEFSSAGTYAVKGDTASPNSVIVMKEIGIDISRHIANSLTREAAEDADIILTLTDSHKKMVLSSYPSLRNKVFTLLEYVGECGDIADPFGGDIQVYRNCSVKIKSSIEKLLLKLKES